MHKYNAKEMNETDEDHCPRCGDDKLRGFDNYEWVVCFTCEWTIRKQAWKEAWN